AKCAAKWAAVLWQPVSMRWSSTSAHVAPRRVPLRVDSSAQPRRDQWQDRKSTRLNSSHVSISYAVFCLKKKKKTHPRRESNTPPYTSAQYTTPARLDIFPLPCLIMHRASPPGTTQYATTYKHTREQPTV